MYDTYLEAPYQAACKREDEDQAAIDAAEVEIMLLLTKEGKKSDAKAADIFSEAVSYMTVEQQVQFVRSVMDQDYAALMALATDVCDAAVKREAELSVIRRTA